MMLDRDDQDLLRAYRIFSQLSPQEKRRALWMFHTMCISSAWQRRDFRQLVHLVAETPKQLMKLI